VHFFLAAGREPATKEEALNAQLVLLIKAQAIDSEIQQSEITQKKYHDEITRLEESLQREEEVCAREKESFQNLEKEHRRLERVLEEMNGRREKAQDKSLAVKTNKEYQAALQEIEGIREAIKKQEDELLDIMVKTDVLKVQLKKTEEQLKKSRAEQSRKKQQIEADLDRYMQEIEAQKAARIELVAAIKPEVLSNYDKLREAKNGLAVVITKNELCMGCNMKIPPQSYNLVITSNEIIYCPNCRRMLYIASEPEQTESTGREPGSIKQTA
jgi:predicted  nucleic acid-binding Zn-ribbon protein